ncbi:hypothetical protein BDZ97DRAFT_1802823 [Flammula alnicola]|nr:hypothetical protein BDZ97DRAFT_1802823 [Flammula alnicola]
MEDPWANAWGDPSKSSLPDSSTLATSSTWSAPSVSVLQGDHEDDLSTSSWPIKPTSAWADPDIPETSLWVSDASTAWNPAPSTFDRISLASKESVSETEMPFPESASQDVHESTVHSPSSSSTTDEAPHPTTAGDSEGWGSPSRPAFSLPSGDVAAWGAETWEAPASAAETTERRDELDDAWETARQQKEKQDRHVPPELLASILRQFEELSNDLWPDSGPTTESQYDKEPVVDMESLGLNSVMQRLVPEDLVLPVNVPFSKTFTSKQLSEALRLTRHSHLTRTSPMALYMASKGSISWEASIKAKPNIIPDDFTPAGWKIVEATKEDVSSPDEGKKKPSGGLLSFFGRKATNPPSDASSIRRSASPVSISGASSVKTGASPRASVDSGRPSTAQSQAAAKSTPASPSVVSFGSIVNQKNDSNAVSVSSTTSTNIPADGIVREPTPPPPSAMSRFLGRFSTRSRTASRDSMALSSDDLEFLEDVPTARSPDVDNSASLDALSMMIKSPPLPTRLPEPLAPPPRAPPQPSRPPQPPAGQQPQNDDFMSFFDTLDNEPKVPAPNVPLHSVLTAMPIPRVKPNLVHHSTPFIGTPDQTSDQTSRRIKGSEDQSWPSFDYPSMPTNRSAPSQTKRPFVAIMASSTKTSSTTPPLLPKPTSAFSLPPPPSTSQRAPSNSDLLSGSSNSIAPLRSSPSSRSHTPLRSQLPPPPPPPIQPVNIDDDDDFSDFLSSPAQAAHPAHLSFNDFAPAVTHSALPPSSTRRPTTSNDLHDSFDDFLNPLPPQPPAKPTPFASNSSSPRSFSPKLSKSPPVSQEQTTGLTRKISRKADHSRTLSLLETAAARGRWLAPPSPLPEALPPPDSRNGKSSNADFFGGGSMQAQQAQAAASLTGSFSSPALASNGFNEKPLPTWNFPPPMNATPLQPAPRTQGSQSTFSGYSAAKPPPPLQPPLQPPPTQNGHGSASSAGAKTGGLSAQDLSFFEGL